MLSMCSVCENVKRHELKLSKSDSNSLLYRIGILNIYEKVFFVGTTRLLAATTRMRLILQMSAAGVFFLPQEASMDFV